MTTVSEQVAGIQIGSSQLLDLEYADDTVILSSSSESIKTALRIYQAEASKLGLEVNWTKTKIMHVADDQTPPTIETNNDSVEVVSSFVYLGSTLTRTGDVSLEINRRRGLAAGVM